MRNGRIQKCSVLSLADRLPGAITSLSPRASAPIATIGLAPPPPPPPPPWTGFYVGLNAGGTWSNNSDLDVVTVPAFINPLVGAPGIALALARASAFADSAVFSFSNGGFIGGGQIGYNYQFGPSFVAGVEADIQGIAGSRKTDNFFGVAPVIGFPPFTERSALVATRSTDYIGTVRGRLGWLVTPTFLVYGTGGFAYGGIQSSAIIFSGSSPPIGDTPVALFRNESLTRGGWTAGGGVEWMFAPNWSVKAEYLYYHLGDATYFNGALSSVAIATGRTIFTNLSQTRTSFNGNIVRAGLNWHFFAGPPPVVAK